jgi:tetratricopeptide (TPR) repeat protein
MTRLKHSRRITILRDDHVGETLGAIFLDPAPEKAEWTIALLRGYLGPRVRIRKVELQGDRAEIELEAHVFSAEANSLAAVAHDLHRVGAHRAALELWRETLKLDPLNGAAAKGAGLVLLEKGSFAEALAMLKRAREFGFEDADVLFGLGRASLRQERVASAMAYFERACAIAPNHFAARRALAEFGRKPRVQQLRSQAFAGPRTPKPATEQIPS